MPLQILEEANRHSMEERIRCEKDKKINLYGETRLHEAARGSDTQYLEMLIEMVSYNYFSLSLKALFFFQFTDNRI